MGGNRSLAAAAQTQAFPSKVRERAAPGLFSDRRLVDRIVDLIKYAAAVEELRARIFAPEAGD